MSMPPSAPAPAPDRGEHAPPPGYPSWPAAVSPPSSAPVPSSAPRRSRSGGLLLGLAAIVAVGGLAFAVGRVTAPAAAGGLPVDGGFGNRLQAGGGPGGSFDPAQVPGGLARRAMTTEATVTAVAADHLTIQLEGSDQTIDITVDASTTYHTQQPADASAVTEGSRVLLQFSPSTDAGDPAGAAPGSSAAPAGAGFPAFRGTVTDVTVLEP